MKTYKFEITLTEEQLAGDEWWEEIIEEHPTGVPGLYKELRSIISEGFHLYDTKGDGMDDVLILKSYEDK